MTTLVVLVGLLVLTVMCMVIGNRLHLPYPILMLLSALAITFVPGFPQIQIDSHLILPLFLPPLLFVTAQTTSWSVFRNRWRTLLVMALGLTAMSAFLVAGLMWALVPGFTFPLALMVGAMCAPPDPVAVDAVAKPAKIPRRILSILQTEGLFNDAVAIVLFQAAMLAATQGDELGAMIALKFLLGAALAIAIGFAIGALYRLGVRLTDSLGASVAISVVAPFAAYIIAEALGVSGVIAVVVTALETNRRRSAQDGEIRVAQMAFWEVANLMVTGIAFGLMGISLRRIIAESGDNLGQFVFPAVVACVAVVAVRFVVSWLMTMFIEPSRHGSRFREAILLTWCGMRGVATLALALSLPLMTSSGVPLPMRSTIMVVATAVLLVTLVPTGLTLPWLTRFLGTRQNPEEIHAQLGDLVTRMQQAIWQQVRESFPGKRFTPAMREILRSRFITIREELGIEVPAELRDSLTLGFEREADSTGFWKTEQAQRRGKIPQGTLGKSFTTSSKRPDGKTSEMPADSSVIAEEETLLRAEVTTLGEAKREVLSTEQALESEAEALGGVLVKPRDPRTTAHPANMPPQPHTYPSVGNLTQMITVAGNAARAELLVAREEREWDPHLVDVVLRKIDLRMLSVG